MDQKTSKKHAAKAIELTDRIIRECGPRLCGTDACKRSAEILRDEFAHACDSAVIEGFDVRPNAFLGFLKASAVAYTLASVFLFFGYLVPAVLGYTFAVVITFSQFVFYRQIFDPFYRKGKGYNVVGVIEPSGEARQQVIVSGHHDSALIFNFFTRFPFLYKARILFAFLSIDIAFIMAWIWVIMECVTGSAPPFAGAMRYTAFFAMAFVGQLWFFAGPGVSPGAGDNLVASAIAAGTAGLFAGKKRPAHTRLIFVSYDAEESGLRGARAYARRHREELRSLPAWNFNMDCIFDPDQIKFLFTDLNGFVRLSRKMADECVDIAGSLGYRARPFRFLFGAGGTDAAEMAAIGVRATTLVAMSEDIARDTFYYHTSRDTVDHIQPGAVAAALAIVHRYILKKDGEARGI